MAPDIDYLALAPEITLAVTAVVVLLLDLFLPRSQKYWTAIVAVLGVSFAALPLIALAASDIGERSMLGGSFVVDDFALVLKGLFVVAGYLVLLMSVSYIESDRYYQGEYYFLMVLSILGSVVLASSRDLITLFIAIELVSQPMYLLAGWRKGDLRSNEASLKYYLLGVLASALLLYGMSFVYGLTGELTFAGIAAAGAGMAGDPGFIMAILFMIAGFGFKVSAVPFHFWAPDTYEGAPTPVTAYLSVSSKAAGFVALLVVLYSAFPDAAGVWGPAIWILAALSMTLANLTALRQTNIVRLLAYSSVAQAGFMLVPFAAAATTDAVGLGEAFAATVTYIVIYAFMNLGAFAVVIAGARKTGTGEIEGWGGLRFLRARYWFAGRGFLLLAGRDSTAGRVDRQAGDVQRCHGCRLRLDGGSGGDCRAQRRHRPLLLRPGSQDHLDGPGSGDRPRRRGEDRSGSRFPEPGPGVVRCRRGCGRFLPHPGHVLLRRHQSPGRGLDRR